MATIHEKFVHLTPELYEYMVAHGRNHDPILAELAEEDGPVADDDATGNPPLAAVDENQRADELDEHKGDQKIGVVLMAWNIRRLLFHHFLIILLGSQPVVIEIEPSARARGPTLRTTKCG